MEFLSFLQHILHFDTKKQQTESCWAKLLSARAAYCAGRSGGVATGQRNPFLGRLVGDFLCETCRRLVQ
jgi:hypothetical protein